LQQPAVGILALPGLAAFGALLVRLGRDPGEGCYDLIQIGEPLGDAERVLREHGFWYKDGRAGLRHPFVSRR
jgi:hypothetical protein